MVQCTECSIILHEPPGGRSVSLSVCLQSVYMESDDCRVLEAAALVHMIKQLSERAAGNMRVMCMESLQDIDPKRP